MCAIVSANLSVCFGAVGAQVIILPEGDINLLRRLLISSCSCSISLPMYLYCFSSFLVMRLYTSGSSTFILYPQSSQRHTGHYLFLFILFSICFGAPLVVDRYLCCILYMLVALALCRNRSCKIKHPVT